MAALGGLSIAGLKRFKDMLSFSITEIVPMGFNGDYLKLLMDIEIQNPSAISLPIELKTAKILFNGGEIGHVRPQKIKLKAGGNTKLKDLEIRLYPKRMGQLAWKMLTTQKGHFINSLLPNFVFHAFFKTLFFPFDKQLKYETAPKQLGLVAAGRRNIKDGSKYDHLIDRPTGTTREVQKNGNVDDTVKWAAHVVKKYHRQVQRLAEYLQSKSSTKKGLFRNIFDFCHNHIQYHLDRPGVEELRTPAMTWHERKSGVDCDDFTMIIASILYCLKIAFGFRITKYGGKQNYQHIYLIVPIENGQHITIDPVLDKFNYEKPFSDHKDYDMQTLNLAGTDELGIPIEILAGTATNEEQRGTNLENIYKLACGHDLQGIFNGLGSPEEDSQAMLRYLKRLRNVYATNPGYIADYQDPVQAIKMLDYAIQYWNTDKRQAALDKLAKIEGELIEQGQINLEGFDDGEGWAEDTGYSGTEPELSGFEYRYPEQINEWEEDIAFSGVEPEQPEYEYSYPQPEWEEDYSFSGAEAEQPGYEYDYSIDGLGGRRRRRRKARKAARRARRARKKATRRARRKSKGGLFKRLSNVAKKGVKFVAKTLVKAGATPLRLALLAALRTNVRGISDKFKYAYLTEQQAIAKGIDINEFKKLKKAHGKLENIFKKLGGRGGALKKAILSGKRKNLRGFEQIGGAIRGITELEGWEQDTGYTGNEAENPQNEYKYDNQIWRVDGQFSGMEPENANYEYDYSFDGVEGRRIRFRRRRNPKRRWSRRLPSQTPNRASYKQGRYNKQKRQISEVAGELLENIQAELKTVQFDKIVKRSKIKKDFLDALANNYGHISTILAYGLKTGQQATTEGVSSTEHQKIRNALLTAQRITAQYGGTSKETNKAVLIGKDKANLEGLGAALAAAGAAAGLISKIVSWIKDIKLKKQAKKQAKASYTAAGGSKKDWRAEGKNRFNAQWAGQMDTAPSSPALPYPTPGATTASLTAQKGAFDFTDIIRDKVQEKFKRAANGGATLPATATPGTTTEERPKGFWEKHKKKALIGGGILITGAIGYGIYKHRQSKKGQSPKALSGTQKRSKTPTRKTPARRTPATGKVVAVTLT